MATKNTLGEGSPHGMDEDAPFELKGDILTAHPELKDLGDYLYDAGNKKRNARIKEIPRTISALFVNLRTVENCLTNVEKGEPTVNILYGLDVAQTALADLIRHLSEYALHRPTDPAPKYAPFTEAERQRFLRIREQAFAVIGEKVRQADSVYR